MSNLSCPDQADEDAEKSQVFGKILMCICLDYSY